jgi:hypothetical protein
MSPLKLSVFSFGRTRFSLFELELLFLSFTSVSLPPPLPRVAISVAALGAKALSAEEAGGRKALALKCTPRARVAAVQPDCHVPYLS